MPSAAAFGGTSAVDIADQTAAISRGTSEPRSTARRAVESAARTQAVGGAVGTSSSLLLVACVAVKVALSVRRWTMSGTDCVKQSRLRKTGTAQADVAEPAAGAAAGRS